MYLRSSSFKRTLVRLLAASAVAALGACADGSSAPELRLSPNDASAGNLSRVYRLGIGDKLSVNVFGEPNLSGSFDVGATGAVSMPLIGDIQANGRPISEFRQAVASRLSQGYLKNPKVSVDIVKFRPIYIHGEVRQGGEHAYRSGNRIRDAIAQAGGYTYRAEKSFVLVIREGQSQEYKVRLPSSFEVLPGDNIRVPERFF